MKILTAYGWFIAKGKKRSGGKSRSVKIITKAEFADHLRRNMTTAEKRIWPDLKLRGFLAQQIIRGYIPDFVHPIRKIVIEVDGSVHDSLKDRDSAKDDRLQAAGYQVLRFTNHQVFFELNRILSSVDKICG